MPVMTTNSETNGKATAVTNEAGVYDVPYLQAGLYTFSATAAGFKTYERTKLAFRVGSFDPTGEIQCGGWPRG